MERRRFVQLTGMSMAAAFTKRQQMASQTVAAKGLTRASVEQAEYDPNAVGLLRFQVISLDGDWHFKEDPKEIGEPQEWYRPGSVRGRIGKAPLPWQLSFPELFEYQGTGWYERDFLVPADFTGKRIALASYGISDHATIWINGQRAGEHRGQQSPFLLDVTGLVRLGTNTITVRAYDPGSILEKYCTVRRSGLWQSIWLEATNKTYVADVFLVPDIDHSQVEARITILSSEHRSKTQRLTLKLLIDAPDGKRFTETRELEEWSNNRGMRVTIPVELKERQLWELDAPRLYRAQVLLMDAGKVLDGPSVEFGMRKIEARGDRFYLNNKPIYLQGGGLDPGSYGGAVDVNWHVPPPYRPQTAAEFKHIIEVTKSLGINLVRIPLRPAPPGLLYWADRLGLLIWQGGGWSGTASHHGQLPPREELLNRWGAVLLRDQNHPSVVLWELFNESGGMDHKTFRTVTSELYDFVRSVDETRVILGNAGGWAVTELNYIDNHPPKSSDIDDWHYYPPFNAFADVRELLNVRSHGKPLTVGEWGPIPYICDADKIKQRWGGKAPWYLSATSKDTPGHRAWSGGYEERFYAWNLDKVYGNFKAFTEASDWYYFEGLKQQTDLMRMNGDIAGEVVWLADTTFHPVGLIDYFREKKVFCDELSKIWTPTAVVVDIPARRNFWASESVRADVHVSHFGDSSPFRGSVRWSIEESDLHGTISGFSIPAGEVRHIGQIEFQAPSLSQSKSVRLNVEVERNGSVIAQNYIRLQVFPLSYRTSDVKSIMLRGPIPWRLEALGYDVKRLGDSIVPYGAIETGPREFDLRGVDVNTPLVTTRVDAATLRLLENGTTVLCLVCGDLLFTAAHLAEQKLDMSVLPFLRQHGLELGSKSLAGHSDSFFIKKNSGLFGRIPFNNPIAWPFEKVWPEHVIVGIKPENHMDVLAGAYGNMITSHALDMEGRWLAPNEVNATILQCRYGKGRLILSTFELLEKKSVYDPVGTIMLNDLISYAHSRFDPMLRLR
jgi:glycosyl hydrolase family 2